MKLMVLAALILSLGCETIPVTPAQCIALANAALDVSVKITETAEGAEKAAVVAEYAEIVSSIADAGCSFVPVDTPAPEDQ